MSAQRAVAAGGAGGGIGLLLHLRELQLSSRRPLPRRLCAALGHTQGALCCGPGGARLPWGRAWLHPAVPLAALPMVSGLSDSGGGPWAKHHSGSSRRGSEGAMRVECSFELVLLQRHVSVSSRENDGDGGRGWWLRGQRAVEAVLVPCQRQALPPHLVCEMPGESTSSGRLSGTGGAPTLCRACCGPPRAALSRDRPSTWARDRGCLHVTLG